MPLDIGELLDHGSWPRLGKLVTLLCAIAIVFDGFDISVVGFAIPAIAKDWSLKPASFSPLVVIGLVGMTVGSTFAGVVGDRIGRRAALMLSVLIFGIAITLSAFAPNLLTIEILRFIAATGIGGALPNAATMSAEFTPLRMRAVAVMVTIVCVPLGGALAGSVASHVLPAAGWRMLFVIGGVVPICLSLLMMALMPESPRFLCRQGNRLAEVRRILQRLGHAVAPDSTFVESISDRPTKGMLLNDFFEGAQKRSTLALWMSFFSSAANVYMCFSWLPTLLKAEGLDLASSSRGLAAYNYGGVAGVLVFAALVNRFGSRLLTLCATFVGLVTALVLVSMEMRTGAIQVPLLGALAAHGFCVNAVQTSLFALGVHLYPTRVRSTGVAVASACGRLGAIVSALLGPRLIHLGRAEFFEYLALAMGLAFVGLAILRNHIPKVGSEMVAVK